MVVEIKLRGGKVYVDFFLYVQLGVRVQAGINEAFYWHIHATTVEVETLEDEEQSSRVCKKVIDVLLRRTHLVRSAICARHQVEAKIGVVFHEVVTVEQQQIFLALIKAVRIVKLCQIILGFGVRVEII